MLLTTLIVGIFGSFSSPTAALAASDLEVGAPIITACKVPAASTGAGFDYKGLHIVVPVTNKGTVSTRGQPAISGDYFLHRPQETLVLEPGATGFSVVRPKNASASVVFGTICDAFKLQVTKSGTFSITNLTAADATPANNSKAFSATFSSNMFAPAPTIQPSR